MPEPAWRHEGTEPDYRFTLANERTFLAWIRTALALLAGGVLLHQRAARGAAHRHMIEARAR
jgi:putative membrane protein